MSLPQARKNDPSPWGDVPKTPPEAWAPLVRLARRASRPVERFLEIEATSGLLLLLAAGVALAFANSTLAADYAHFWHTPMGFRIGSVAFQKSLEWVVNDILMVVFFFVVGMEIRREISHGALSEFKRATLPIMAALGGMAAPALLYIAIAGAPDTRHGWGIPMATDIAFALGVLALLGRRVPPALRVLLLAVAVIDDLGAIVVIAVFYSGGIDIWGLWIALAGVGGIFAMRLLGVRNKVPYLIPGVVVWAGVAAAGIHPTIAGVVVGLLTPVRAWLGPQAFIEGVRSEVERLEADEPASLSELTATLHTVNFARREALSPADGLIDTLHPWNAYLIMPIFALTNAGVTVDSSALDASALRVIGGVAVGLIVGKAFGVAVATWLAVKLRIGVLQSGLSWAHVIVLGLVAGVGFTMAIFISNLAFEDPKLLGAAKLAILAASAVAAVLAFGVGRLTLKPPQVAEELTGADEAVVESEGLATPAS